MAKVGTILAFAISVLLISSWVQVSHCLKKPAGVARREDIPYIKCQVCEKVAAQLYHQVQKKQSQISAKKVSEFHIIEIAENVCNLKKEEADWILRLDIVEQGDRLELIEQDSEGQCNSECKTIERACEEVMGYSDTDVAEYLYKRNPGIDSLVNYLCKDLTDSCNKKPPPLPKDRSPGEPFVPKSSKEAEMEKILKSMEGMPGAPNMKMYSREDLMNQNFGDENDDEDEDDNEENFSSNLKKVLREKKSEHGDWKQRLMKGIIETGETVKQHINKVANQIQQWWEGKAMTKSKKNSKGKNAEL